MVSRFPPLRGKRYVSDFEQFLARYKTAHPEVEAQQQQGWYLLWDRHVDPADLQVPRKDRVPVKGYQYD